jgi:catechol 2,3-dioxygenase-like lactoylglutathione lyase family enzyme
MPRVRYVAVLAESPANLAAFYRDSFGLRTLGESPAGDVSLTDGAINLTLFKLRPELGEARMERGLHHIGVEVDNIERAKSAFRRFNPRCLIVPEDADLHHGEVRFHDAESIPVSVSQRPFGVPGDVVGVKRIVHIGFDVLDPDAECNFFVRVLGFTERARRGNDRPERVVGDDHITLTFRDVYRAQVAYRPRYGLSHLSFADPSGPATDPEGNRIAAAVAAVV